MSSLPESFTLPTGQDYDRLVEAVGVDIEEEGGARYYLGSIRFERRQHESFYAKTLRPMAKLALRLEDMHEERKLTRDSEHRLANAVVSGMLFGNVMNEATYPFFNEKIQPYRNICVYDNLLGEQKEAFDASGGTDKLTGRRIGYRAMSNFILGQLSDESLLKVDGWSESLIPNQDFRPYFLQGVGMSLYVAWDVYSDWMVEDGRADEVRLLGTLQQDR